MTASRNLLFEDTRQPHTHLRFQGIGCRAREPRAIAHAPLLLFMLIVTLKIIPSPLAVVPFSGVILTCSRWKPSPTIIGVGPVVMNSPPCAYPFPFLDFFFSRVVGIHAQHGVHHINGAFMNIVQLLQLLLLYQQTCERRIVQRTIDFVIGQPLVLQLRTAVDSSRLAAPCA